MQPKKLLAVSLFPLMLGASVHANAGIFDDILDGVKNLFSSAKNLVEDVVDKIDKELGENIASLCSVVKATNEDGETSTSKAIDQCGGKVVDDLEGNFKKAGGDIADQYNKVQDGLETITEETWADASDAFVELVDTLTDYYTVIFDNLEDASEQVINSMKDVKTTLQNVDFPYGNIAPMTNLALSFTVPLAGGASIEFQVRGQTTAVVTDAEGSNYIALNGSVLAKLKYGIPFGLYQPGVSAILSYTNPIIRYQDDKITGLLVDQPSGSIALTGVVSPLAFSVGLAEMTGISAVKKLPIIGVAAQAISVSMDIGTMAFTVPITGQTGNDLNVVLSISGGIEAKANITSLWSVKLSERVSWSKPMTLDIPSWDLSTSSIPDAVTDKLVPTETEQPSYAERILWYTFDDDSSTVEDKSNFGNHGKLKKGVDIKNGVAKFDGDNDYIDLPDNLMENLDAITVYAEVKVDKDQGNPYWIFGLGNEKDGGGNGYLFATGSNYRAAISTCNWSCEQNLGIDGVKLPSESWQTIAYTLKDGVATLYLNGDVVAEKKDMTIKPSEIGGGHTDANYLGRSLYDADKYFHGEIRNFQIWNGALTHSEIVANAKK